MPGIRRARKTATIALVVAALTTAHAPRTFAQPDAADSAATRPTWALVLSGGIARGFAHAGVIQALEEQGARPDLVVGSSMGGLVAAMYAAGYSPDSMRAILHTVPWDNIFSGLPTVSQWRALWPGSWFELVSGGGGSLQIPAAIADNTIINAVLVDLFITADAAAQGDFDRLPVPFRTIGTDVRTGRWVMLDRGSLALACRITSGLPLVFPPVARGDALLVDGGMSSNLPITPAREAGADRVLAVDVALPYPELDESSSGIVVFLQLWDVLNKRGQSDTVSTVAGDTLLWLKVPNADAMDFAGAAEIMAEGYAEAEPVIRSWVPRSGVPTTREPLTPPDPVMPPLAEAIEWTGRGPVQRSAVARAVLGRLPEGPFRPAALSPALHRLSRSGLFESAWPTLENRGDSTVLSFEVRERPVLAIGPAFTVGNDEGGRVHLNATYRPTQGPLPAVVRMGVGWRNTGGSAQVSLEPYALDQGSWGWFARGRYHELGTRVFVDGEEVDRPHTNRGEAFLGGQVSRPFGQNFQAGAGWADVRGSGPQWSGPILAFRTQAPRRNERTIEGEWAIGDDGYARATLFVDQSIHLWKLSLTPGVRLGAADGEVPYDALVGLGGPHSLSGLHYDEWLGKRMWATSMSVALEGSRNARLYVEGQVGEVKDAASGTDIGPGAQTGIGLGAELDLPPGPLRLEWGAASTGRHRLDFILGVRF